MKITLVAPYERLAYDAKQVCMTYGERVDIVVGTAEQGVRLAQKAVQAGTWVMISRGGTWLQMCQELSVPVIEIAVTPYDVLRALQKVRHRGTRFGVVGSRQVIGSMTEWCSLLSVPVFPIETNENAEFTLEMVKQGIARDGIDCLLGDARALKYSSQLGIPSVLIESGKEAIWVAIQEAKRIAASCKFEQEKNSRHVSNFVLDSLNHGVLLIDNNTVQFANRTMLELIGIEHPVAHPIDSCLPASLRAFVERPAIENDLDQLFLGGRLWFAERTMLSSERRILVTIRQVDGNEPILVNSTSRENTGGHVAQHTFSNLIGQSDRMQALVTRAKQFSKTESTILITGETGTGKEVFAQSIHNASTRAGGPFVAVNCAALPEPLLESELFGYDPGAFTGARKNGKSGLFELAEGGTIFLDEIGDTSLSLQKRLLRVLQERTLMKIGSEKVVPIDVRVIAATNQPLWTFVEQGKFREDLYFRLDVLRLQTLPLREMTDDIPEMAQQILQDSWYKSKGVGAQPQFDPSVVTLLQTYTWPGNVRELENMVEYIISICSDGWVDRDVVDEWFANRVRQVESTRAIPESSQIPLQGSLEQIERFVIEAALQSTRGDMGKVAEQLGISRTTLWRKIKQWDDRAPRVSF